MCMCYALLPWSLLTHMTSSWSHDPLPSDYMILLSLITWSSSLWSHDPPLSDHTILLSLITWSSSLWSHDLFSLITWPPLWSHDPLLHQVYEDALSYLDCKVLQSYYRGWFIQMVTSHSWWTSSFMPRPNLVFLHAVRNENRSIELSWIYWT